MNQTRHFPSLDGWRAIAILLVLGRHLPFVTGLPPSLAHALEQLDGELGVRFFFTISGFLITWLLLNEERTSGRASLRRFYARRAVRIVPVYAACLLVLGGMQLLDRYHQPPSIWLQLLTFTRNFHQTASAECLPSSHLWSLSVEEQFYLIWPLAFSWLRGAPARRLLFLAAVCAVSAIWKTVSLLGCYNRHLYFLFQADSTFVQMDCLAFGCLAALALELKEETLRSFFQRYAPVILFSACLLILIPALSGLGKTLQTLAFTFLLLQSVLVPGLIPFKLLNFRWLAGLGILSYSVYIWQQLVFLYWPFPRCWFLAMPGVLVAAGLSYWCLERPFFRLRRRLRPATRAGQAE